MNLTQERFVAIELPLPPLAEQKEIVRRVEQLFALADAIEARLAQGTEQVNRLTQAVLAKAFRGELVPTQAELSRRTGHPFETAAELLARIGASQPQKKNGRGRKRSS